MDDKVATAEKSFKLLLPQTLAAFFVTSLHLLVGQVIAFSGIIVPQLFEDANGTIPITESGGAWIASAPVFSGFAASIVGGMLSDSIGRLNTLMWAGLPGIVGSVLIAMAPNLSMIIWGRAIMGISWMFVSVATPVYISEISHPDIRGFLLTFLQVFLSLGSVLVYLKGWAMSWRIVSWITILYIAVPVVLIFFMPESPPWLVSKGRNDRARKSLEWLHSNHPNLKEKVEKDLCALQAEHEEKLKQSSEKLTLKEHLKMYLLPTFYKPFLIICGIITLQQFTGIYVLLFNSVIFFKDIGTDKDPYLASVCICSVKVVMSVVNTWFMKTFNRRPLLITSAVGMAVCMGLSGMFTQWIQEGSTYSSWIPVSLVLLYIMFGAIGIMSVPFLVAGELFPLAIRGIAYSLIITAANVMTFAALQAYFPLYHALGGSAGLQYFFGAVSVAVLVFIYVFLPETHKFTLTEIENHFWTHSTYLFKKNKVGPCTDGEQGNSAI
ncbi:hypothetical protein PPYR_03645 [Photinus pyralis]|uniref:Major facilitator superfamily (MFS) profile domain-containing protein n=3 Tax=Photinus pyralis TaxID=7054 RepID=A0A1Y1KW28_PHOPY|nr:facilitated trehalose transporter Tret1-2 homolog [Photinus pyralis]KAB0791845.1 hypothetical protein PPYR_03645 [Photinus pyralis]